MNLFYHNTIAFESLSKNDIFQLPEEEALHAIKVLRMKVNEKVNVTDGKGYSIVAEILSADKKNINLKIISKTYKEKATYKTMVAVAPTKNPGRMEWFLEKSTEMGIDEIFPILCEHSEKKNFNPERMSKVITAAVKQSLQSYHPVLHELISFNKLLELPVSAKKIIAHYDENNPVFLKDLIQKNENILVIIGPEGDFSNKELDLAKKMGIPCAILGHTRLRTETAALNACFTINLINQ